MADLIAALSNPAFGAVPSWIEVDKEGKPLDPSKKFEVPTQQKVHCPLGGKKDITASIALCNAESLEHFLAFTNDQWEKQIVQRLPENLQEDGHTLFKLFPLILGVTGTSAWQRVLDDNGVDVTKADTCTMAKWKECRICYCSELAGIKYPGDSVIRWLRFWKKPYWMTPEEYLRRRATVLAYANTGLLRSKLSMPTGYDLAEAVFLGMPKPYQEKYAEKNDEVSTDLVALKNAFTQYHAADVRNGALAKIIKERESRKRPHQPPTTKYDKKRRTGRRDGYRDDRGGRRDHRDRRDRDYDRRDDRRNDRGGRGGYRGRDGYNNRGGDDRKGSGGNGDAKKPPYKNAAHHVDDNDDQQSKSSGRSRSSTPRRDRSPSYDSRHGNDDAFMAEQEAYNAERAAISSRDEARPMEEFSYSDEEKERHQEYYNSRKPKRGWRNILKGKKSSFSSSEPR